jgi:FlgN protein
MQTLEQTPGTIAGYKDLVAALEKETTAYRRLMRLAVRQNRYMRRQDTARLEENTQEWRRYLPEANELRLKRVEIQRPLQKNNADDMSPRVLLDDAPASVRAGLRDVIELWATVIGELNRQNSINGMLVKFCLDTVHEEVEIFRRVVSGESDGCYNDNGSVSGANFLGVISQQA